MASQVLGKSKRTQQRHRAKTGAVRPVGRPQAALDSVIVDMYVKVTRRELTIQEAADQCNCSVRTLQRHFKNIRQSPDDYRSE